MKITNIIFLILFSYLGLNAQVISNRPSSEQPSPHPSLENIYFVDTHADVIATTAVAGTVIRTLGYYEPGDGGAAEYIIKATAEGLTVDTAFVVKTAANRYAHMLIKNSQVDVRQIGFMWGDLGALYDSSETILNVKRKYNWLVTKKAMDYVDTRDIDISFPAGVGEVYVSDGSTYQPVNGASITWSGSGKDKTDLWFFPAGANYTEVAITVGTGKSVKFTAKGMRLSSFPAELETYEAILNFGGDTTKVKLISSNIRQGFIDSLLVAGKKIYLSWSLGYRAKKFAISGYDSGTKIITLGARDLTGRQPTTWAATSNDTGYVAMVWPTDIEKDSALSYGFYWAGNSGIPGSILTFINDTHSSVPAGYSDTCYYNFNDVYVYGWYSFFESVWGNTFIDVDNTTVECQSLGFSRFNGSYLWDHWFKMRNSSIINTGCLTAGTLPEDLLSGDPDILNGSGLYLHPNVPTELINCTFENNVAVPARNYSSTGSPATFPYNDGDKILIENCKFLNNGDAYHYQGSSTLPVTIDKCYFDQTNSLLVQRDVTIINSTLDSTLVVPYGYDDSEIYGFKVKFINCELPGHSLNNTPDEIEYNGCNITPSSSLTTFNFGRKIFSMRNSRVRENLNIAANVYGLFPYGGSPMGEMIFDNVVFDSTNLPLFYRMSRANLLHPIVMRDVTLKQGIAASASPGSISSFDYALETDNVRFAGNGTSPIYGGFGIAENNFKNDINLSVKTPVSTAYAASGYLFPYVTSYQENAKTLTLDVNHNTFKVGGGLIDRIVMGNPINNSLFKGRITLIADSDFWFAKYDSLSNTKSNVMVTDTVLKGESIDLFLDPTTALYIGTASDSITIGTGNGTTTNFTKWVDGSVYLIKPGTCTITVDGNTYIDDGKASLIDSSGNKVGWVSYGGNWYGINFETAPLNGSVIKMYFTKYSSLKYQGVFRKL